MWNFTRLKGAAPGVEPSSGKAVTQPSIKLGVVKDTIDPLRAGRMRVYIEGMGGNDPDDERSWTTVSYCSPFYGQTLSSSPGEGYGEFPRNTHSWGFWGPAPDIGTTVLVAFVNQDPNFGYYIASVPEPAHLQTLPAAGTAGAIPGTRVIPNNAEAESFRGAPRLPALNINSNNDSLMSNGSFLIEDRPVNSWTAAILHQQGLLRDPIRGVISSSAQREAPSRVTGISTPGRPIYSGGYDDQNIADAVTEDPVPQKLKIIGRRGGHSLVLDDGDIIGRDSLVRLRTAAGHQILMSDDGAVLHIIHSNGKTSIELGKEGTVDVYAMNSVNVRSAGDLNLHADRDVNINAGAKLRLKAADIAVESTGNTTLKCGNYSATSDGDYTVGARGISFASSGESSYYSKTTLYLNGDNRINLNTGSSQLQPRQVPVMSVVEHPDTLWDSTLGWLSFPGLLKSIASRVPTHAPYVASSYGVDVAAKTTVDEVLPQQPSDALSSLLAGAGAGNSGSAGATAATVSTAAESDPLIAALLSSLRDIASRTRGGIGIYGLTPQQLEISRVIKPSSSTLVAARLAAGMSTATAIAPSLMATTATIDVWLNDQQSQSEAVKILIERAKRDLIALGVISGAESVEVQLPVLLAALCDTASGVARALHNSGGRR